MRKGNKLYFTHFAIIVCLFGLLFLFAYLGHFGNPFLTLLTFITFLYLVLFQIGALFRRGPLKNIGLGIIQDHKDEIDEMQPKQPWE